MYSETLLEHQTHHLNYLFGTEKMNLIAWDLANYSQINNLLAFRGKDPIFTGKNVAGGVELSKGFKGVWDEDQMQIWLRLDIIGTATMC